MPDALIDLFVQMPVAGLLAVVVWRFLVFIKERDENWLDTTKERDQNWLETVRRRDEHFLGELDKHQSRLHEQQAETIQALRQNATAFSRATQVMEKVDEQLRNDAFEREHAQRANRG